MSEPVDINSVYVDCPDCGEATNYEVSSGDEPLESGTNYSTDCDHCGLAFYFHLNV